MYEYSGKSGFRQASTLHAMGTDSIYDVASLQAAIIENGCSLPAHGQDGRWGPETEAGVRCLAERRGWGFVTQSWSWVPQRMSVPEDALQPEGYGARWYSWAAAAVSFVAIVAIGSYMTRGK